MASTYRQLRLPRWLAIIYVTAAVILLPWTVYLGYQLPVKHLSQHWDISWVGLDAALILTLALTGIFAYRKSKLIVISATSTGCLLLLDAWFDVLSATRDYHFYQALFLAFGVELPLAIMSYRLAYRALERHIAKGRS
ncbi:MAG TPA: hypothetical protein VHD60_02720 [Candidatus Saccharimonadales bacterium]|nr:hypothetical protein [Candidatus Saccharimonadales bacterium]